MKENLDADQTGAALLLSIDQELAAKVMRCLSDDSIDKVTRAMQELEEMAGGPETLFGVFKKSVDILREGGLVLGGGDGLVGGKLIVSGEVGDEERSLPAQEIAEILLASQGLVPELDFVLQGAPAELAALNLGGSRHLVAEVAFLELLFQKNLGFQIH